MAWPGALGGSPLSKSWIKIRATGLEKLGQTSSLVCYRIPDVFGNCHKHSEKMSSYDSEKQNFEDFSGKTREREVELIKIKRHEDL